MNRISRIRYLNGQFLAAWVLFLIGLLCAASGANDTHGRAYLLAIGAALLAVLMLIAGLLQPVTPDVFDDGSRLIVRTALSKTAFPYSDIIRIDGVNGALPWFVRAHLEATAPSGSPQRVEFRPARSFGEAALADLKFRIVEQCKAKGIATSPTIVSGSILRPSTFISTDPRDVLQRKVRDFEADLRAAHPGLAATESIILLNVAVFLLMSATHGWKLGGFDSTTLLRWGAENGRTLYQGQWWRLLSAMFLHMNIVHLALNMFVAYQVGKTVERLYGSLDFVALYLFSGVAGFFISLLIHPELTVVGASGAIFGLYGGLFIFLLEEEKDFASDVRQYLRSGAAGFCIYNLFYGLRAPNVDVSAHVGGLLGGLCMGLLLVRPMDARERAKPEIRHLTVAVLSATAVVCGLGVVINSYLKLQVQNYAFIDVVNAMATTDLQVGRRLIKLNSDVNSGNVTRSQAANEIEQVLIPALNRTTTALSDPAFDGKLNGKFVDEQQSLLKYVALRRNEAEAAARCYRDGDGRFYQNPYNGADKRRTR